MGEHFVVYGAKAILCAIDRRATVYAETMPEKRISIESDIGRLSSKSDAMPEEIDSPLRPLFYLAKKMIERHGNGIAIRVESNIPTGVGLGSSSACCVAGAAAISSLFERLQKDAVLNMAVEAERTNHHNSSGADCTVCTYGGIMEYSTGSGFTKINTRPDFKLVIANSNIEHSTEVVVSDVRRFKEMNREKFSDMLDTEGRLVKDALLQIERNDRKGLGKCMMENQVMLDAIGVSNQRLGEMVNMANEASFGGKITGAGRGGCIIALSDDGRLQETLNRFSSEGIECFPAGIDFNGLNTF